MLITTPILPQNLLLSKPLPGLFVDLLQQELPVGNQNLLQPCTDVKTIIKNHFLLFDRSDHRHVCCFSSNIPKLTHYDSLQLMIKLVGHVGASYVSFESNCSPLSFVPAENCKSTMEGVHVEHTCPFPKHNTALITQKFTRLVQLPHKGHNKPSFSNQIIFNNGHKTKSLNSCSSDNTGKTKSICSIAL